MTATAIITAIVKALTAKDVAKIIYKGVKMGLSIGSLIKYVSVVQKIQAEVSELIGDGDFTPDEAEAEAAKLLGGEDIKLKVSGSDVLDAKAQDYLVRGLARVFANVATAKLS